MFDAAESDPSLTAAQAKPLEAKLRTALLKAQYARLKKADRSLLIVIAGIDGAGKGASISLLNEWMDTRHIRTIAFGEPTPEEKKYPFFLALLAKIAVRRQNRHSVRVMVFAPI